MPPLFTSSSITKVINPPTLIEHKGHRFLIFDAPSLHSLSIYTQYFIENNVLDVVRLCEPTYPSEPLEKLGIQVHELPFSDGKAPPKHIVSSWLDIIHNRFYLNNTSSSPTIGVHCVAGLGRAPVLVAIALIELGMSPLDSVQFVRERRKGAINNRQIEYIETYRRQSRSKCCIC